MHMTGRASCVLVLIGAIVLAATPACAADVTITGTAIGPDGAPVAEAMVGMAHPDAAGVVRRGWTETPTGPDGRFRLTVPWNAAPWRRHSVVARKQGLAFGWAWARDGDDIEIHLGGETVTCSGTVVTTNGQPIAGADVILRGIYGGGRAETNYAWLSHHPSSALGVTSDQQGIFTIPDLPPDAKVNLQVEAQGFAHARSGTVPADATPETLSIWMQPEGRIEGRALRDGQPVSDVTLHASGTSGQGLAAWGYAVSGPDGRYRLDSLAASTYTISVCRAGDWTAPILTGIDVAEAQTVRGVDVELIPGAVVEGTVTLGDTGEPAVGAHIAAQVWAGPTDSLTLSSAAAGEQGTVRFHLPPGRSMVYYQRDYPGYPNAEPHDYSLSLSDGETRTDLVFVLQPAATLAGVVQGPDGESIPGAELFLMTMAHRFPFFEPENPEVTGPDGRFELSLGAWSPDARLQVFTRLPGSGLVWAGAATPEQDMVVELQRGGWLQARTADQQGEPVAGIAAGASLAAAADRSYRIPLLWRSDEDGLLRIGPLPPDEPLNVWLLGEARQMLVGPGWDPFEEYRVAAGEVTELPALTLNPDGRTLRGTVIDAAGEPVGGASVRCTSVIEGDMAVDSTDDRGRFELTGLWAHGQLGVLAVGPDGGSAWGMPCDPDLPLEPTFELAPLCTVEFVIQGADGEPPQEARVSFACNDFHPPWGNTTPPPGLTFSDEVRADAGRCRVQRLVPGFSYEAYALVPDPAHSGPTIRFIAEPGPEPMTVELRGPRTR